MNENHLLPEIEVRFLSACADLSDVGREILRVDQQRYLNALLHYTQLQCASAAKGAARYGALLAIVETFFQFAQRVREFHTLIAINRPRNRPCFRRPVKIFHELVD